MMTLTNGDLLIAATRHVPRGLIDFGLGNTRLGSAFTILVDGCSV
jgi:hypothetical protein